MPFRLLFCRGEAEGAPHRSHSMLLIALWSAMGCLSTRRPAVHIDRGRTDHAVPWPSPAGCRCCRCCRDRAVRTGPPLVTLAKSGANAEEGGTVGVHARGRRHGPPAPSPQPPGGHHGPMGHRADAADGFSPRPSTAWSSGTSRREARPGPDWAGVTCCSDQHARPPPTLPTTTTNTA